MKKSYITPTIQIIDIDSSEVICCSLNQASITYGGDALTQDNYRTTFGLSEGEEIVAGAGGYRSNLWD